MGRNTNARWGMQFIWPIKGDYRIIFLDDNYQLTIIGRAKRDYVWVMSREPEFSNEDFNRVKSFIQGVGYDAAKPQLVRHGKA
jgi:apolipoprotein D and lipocalin family protein